MSDVAGFIRSLSRDPAAVFAYKRDFRTGHEPAALIHDDAIDRTGRYLRDCRNA